MHSSVALRHFIKTAKKDGTIIFTTNWHKNSMRSQAYSLLIKPMVVLHFIWLNKYLCRFFCACINEDEELSLPRPISRWRHFEMEDLSDVFEPYTDTDRLSCGCAHLYRSAGRALPGDVWLRYWFELMTHGSNNFQQTDELLIWLLRFLPSSNGMNSTNSPALQLGSTSLSVFITAPSRRLGLGISMIQMHQFVSALKKKKHATKYTAANCDRSYSLMHFYYVCLKQQCIARHRSIWLLHIDSNWWSFLHSKNNKPQFVLHVLFKYVLWNDKIISPLSPWDCEIVFLMMF